MGMVLSETPLKEFAHSDCKTEGWAEQVTHKNIHTSVYCCSCKDLCKASPSALNCIKIFNKVINQWEITALEIPKKEDKPKTNAPRFCEFIFVY